MVVSAAASAPAKAATAPPPGVAVGAATLSTNARKPSLWPAVAGAADPLPSPPASSASRTGGLRAQISIALRLDSIHLFQLLILAAAVMLQVPAFGPGRGGLVQIDLDVQFPANALAQPASHGYTRVHADVADGDERH